MPQVIQDVSIHNDMMCSRVGPSSVHCDMEVSNDGPDSDVMPENGATDQTIRTLQ